MYRVLLVEDQQLVRDMIIRNIEKSEDFTLQYAIDNAALAEMYCMKGDIDIILMDICTALGESGLEAAVKLKPRYPRIRIVLMTSMPENSFLERAKKADIESFWYKETNEIPLIDVMRRTMEREHVYPETIPQVRIGNADCADFNEDEMMVLRQLTEGRTDEYIAARLHLSIWTVRKHIRQLLKKTGLSSRTGLAVEVTSSGLIMPDY